MIDFELLSCGYRFFRTIWDVFLEFNFLRFCYPQSFILSRRLIKLSAVIFSYESQLMAIIPFVRFLIPDLRSGRLLATRPDPTLISLTQPDICNPTFQRDSALVTEQSSVFATLCFRPTYYYNELRLSISVAFMTVGGGVGRH